MTATALQRQDVIRNAHRDAQRWDRYVESMLAAFRGDRDLPPALGQQLEELRTKRDRVMTKVHALRRHRERNWSRAHRDHEVARRELLTAWRAVIGTLHKESSFT